MPSVGRHQVSEASVEGPDMSTAEPPSRTAAAFDVRRTTTPTSGEDRARLMTDPGFGRVFTDHMARLTWTADGGWADQIGRASCRERV